VRFQAASDQSLLVYLGEEIGAAARERVLQLLQLLQNERVAWIRNIQPAYCSLLVTFDAAVVDHAGVQAKLTEYEERAEKMPAPKARVVEVPVCYGGEFGPDLEEADCRRPR
jgi:allophanate hydrolase subunit 1